MIALKNDTFTEDKRLDRVVQFDDKSRAYPIRQLVANKKPRSYTWRCPEWFDQGQEGACVGFAWAHDLVARPRKQEGISATYARYTIYEEAQKIDEWPGEDYSGTSVLAGVKVLSTLGYIKEYRWAFGLDDLIMAVGNSGPAVLGVNWYSGMFNTDAQGFIHPTGRLVGGHAILCHGVNIKKRVFKLHNSWSRNWGVNGECLISFEDMDRLLHEQGEACIAVKK